MREGPSATKRLAIAASVFGVAVALGATHVAEAHFVLQSPPAWMSQDSLGLPQKLGPCGDEDDGTDASTPTGIVTAVREGSKIKVTINEVIFHPGHYTHLARQEPRQSTPRSPT